MPGLGDLEEIGSPTTAASVAIVSLVVYLALFFLQPILMPLAIAILLYFLIRAPERFLFERVGNSYLSYALVLGSAILVAYIISVVLYDNLSDFIAEIPEINADLDEKLETYSEADLYGLEIIFSSSEVVSRIASPANIEKFAISILGSVGSFMTTMGTVLLFLIFLMLEEKTLPSRFKSAFPDSYDRVETIVANSSDSISTYVISKATCSAGQAAIVTILLSPLVFDIPGWFLFGTLCFLLDFIPVLGALLATIPPIMIGLIVLDPSNALLLSILLIANQQLFGSFIEPNLSGSRLGISPLVLLLTVMLSAQVWGIAGAIIGVPIVIIVRLALEEDERTKPIAMMLAKSYEEE
ncbi:MAG TPA: AI-2E family transporter [Candidatus Thalassarchaeaceae archaeon]|nr:AI-2E family transporter [Candidatus Thalassarchaeaceae archaeon]